ncbi:MAG: SpoIIE family protein phosphatase [Planctomycetia bacterium]|nr:SpoIIE family protein phosphatase [Planctomycetia bacterium]
MLPVVGDDAALKNVALIRRCMMPELMVLASSMKGTRFVLSPNHDVIIGREGFCDVVLTKKTVSRKHARVFFDGEHYQIEDLGSAHGTFLNSRRVTKATVLMDGDRFNVYDIPIAFCQSPELSLAETTSITLGLTDEGFTLTPLPPTNGHSGAIRSQTMFTGRLRQLLEITRRLGSSLLVDEIFPRVLDTLFDMFPQAAIGEIQLIEPDGRLNPVAMKHGRDDDSSIITRVPVGHDISLRVLSNGKPLLKKVDPKPHESVLDDGEAAVICVPMLGPSHTKLGTILLEADDDNRTFTDDDLELVAAVGILTGQAVEYAHAHKELLRMDQSRRQLETARQIQLRMLPRGKPDVPGYRFCKYYAPADAVGGDYYFWDSLPDGRVIMGVADACGKGLPAAMMIAQFATEVRHCLTTAETLKIAMFRLNRFVASLDEGFITFCLCLLDVDHGKLTLLNAGHPPPLCWRKATGIVEQLGMDRSTFPLGIAEDHEFHTATALLQPGDEVLFFTDGLIEAMSPDNSLFGESRVLRHMAAPHDDLQSLIDTIIADVERFRSGRNRSDDTCLIGFTRICE